MTKSRDRPMAGASRRSSRAHSEWKVEIHMARAVAARQRGDALPHLLGRLVGEGDGEHLVRARQPLLHGVRDPVRDDACLAGAGAGENQHRTVGVHHGLALFGIQRREQIHRAGTPS